MNKSRYAILGMLFDEPHSGYEIIQIMKNSTSNFWQESDASIYPVLKKLEAEGKVKSQSEFAGERERKMFEITASGKKDFWAWIGRPTEKEKHRDEMLLKIFFGANINKKDVLKIFKFKLKRCKDIKKTYKQIETDILSKVSDKHPHKIFWYMTLENGIMHVKTESKWIKKCIQILEKSKDKNGIKFKKKTFK